MKRPKRHPEQYTDTDPQAMAVWLELLRSKTPGERIDSALQLSELALRVNEAGVRSRHPNASDEEVRARVAASHLPRELVRAAYGWHPEDGDSV